MEKVVLNENYSRFEKKNWLEMLGYDDSYLFSLGPIDDFENENGDKVFFISSDHLKVGLLCNYSIFQWNLNKPDEKNKMFTDSHNSTVCPILHLNIRKNAGSKQLFTIDNYQKMKIWNLTDKMNSSVLKDDVDLPSGSGYCPKIACQGRKLVLFIYSNVKNYDLSSGKSQDLLSCYLTDKKCCISYEDDSVLFLVKNQSIIKWDLNKNVELSSI